jgi:hypothetical protein
MYRFLILCIIPVVCLLTSCANVKQYEGPVRPPSEIAAVTISNALFTTHIDGVYQNPNHVSTMYNLLPGEHTFVLKLDFSVNTGIINSTWSGDPVSVTFDVKAGNKYKITFFMNKKTHTYNCLVKDVKTKEIVSK